MKKDITIAVVFGFILGVITAIIVVNLPSVIKKSPSSEIAQISPTLIPSPVVQKVVNLSIEQPVDETIVSTKNIKISGKTGVGNTIVLESDLDIDTKESSTDGSFSFPVTLTEGGNTLLITSYNEKGNSETKILTVFYTSEKL